MAYRRAKRALPRALYKPNETELTIHLINGASIVFKSGEKPDNLYGEDVWAAVVDEASRVRAESYYAIRSTLTATGGPLRVIGNVKGRRNWFYAMARRGEEGGEADLAFHRLTWKDAVEAGILPASEIVGAQKDLPPAVFRELYEAEASDDEGNPFGFAAIEACLRPGLSLLDPSVWGWDLAKSRDWTVGIGLDEIGDVSRFLRFQKPWKETLATIAEETGSLSALIDSTGVGDPIVEGLQRDHGSNFEGFRFSQSSKQRLMEGLAVAIQTGAVGFPDGPIRQELDEFEYRYTRTGVIYTAPPGFHDDCVIALALAVSYSSSGGRLATPDSLLVDDEPNEIEEIFRE